MGSQGSKFALPKYEDIAESEHGATLKLVLEICHRQQERILLLEEAVAVLKDEVAVLKGEKSRPKIKPSSLNKDCKDNDDDKKESGGGTSQTKRGKPTRSKTQEIEIHDKQIIYPEHIPAGSVFKGYEDYVVQDIEIKPKNTKFRRARFETPDGKYIVGELPKSIQGHHFGSEVRSYIISQYYQQHVPQKLILKQLWEFGVVISAGQLNHIIIDGHEQFHKEKEEILKVGLRVSRYINVDDTGARHQGQNGHCTHIGNEFFAWFSSTKNKSRINFLELLRTGYKDYVIDEIARLYLEQHKLPPTQLALLGKDCVCEDSATWEAHLLALGITKNRHKRIATEGALLASILSHGISSDLVILSDDAGQFNILGLLHALCWVHAERIINKIIPFSEDNKNAQKLVQNQIWNFYQLLKDYKNTPSQDAKLTLQQHFNQIFLQKTCFQSLNLALMRIYKNKSELLLVLDRPEIPLHNNLSENDIRDYVKKRKISATTRSNNGQFARDTFLSLKKTCQKLGISFYKYLQDRISKNNQIHSLPSLISTAAQAP